MKVVVDRSVCELHGQCVAVAPDVFAFDDDDNLVHRDDLPDHLAGQASDAVSFCPAQAISVEG